MDCNESERTRIKGFVSEWPEVVSDNSVLVLGAKPDEDFYGRDFFANPSYYLLDERDARSDRFIKCELMSSTSPNLRLLSEAYCKTFDTVIFDLNVANFIREFGFQMKETFQYLLKTVKDGGVLITEGTPNIVPFLPGQSTSFIDLVKSLGYKTEQMKLGALMEKYPVAKEVYGKIPDLDRKTEDFIVITKTKLTGGRRKSRKIRKNKKRKSRKSVV